jgi:hypothetical protein
MFHRSFSLCFCLPAILLVSCSHTNVSARKPFTSVQNVLDSSTDGYWVLYQTSMADCMKKSGFKYSALPKSSGPGRLTINLPPSSKEDSDWKKLRGYGVASALESTRLRRDINQEYAASLTGRERDSYSSAQSACGRKRPTSTVNAQQAMFDRKYGEFILSKESQAVIGKWSACMRRSGFMNVVLLKDAVEAVNQEIELTGVLGSASVPSEESVTAVWAIERRIASADSTCWAPLLKQWVPRWAEFQDAVLRG